MGEALIPALMGDQMSIFGPEAFVVAATVEIIMIFCLFILLHLELESLSHQRTGREESLSRMVRRSMSFMV